MDAQRSITLLDVRVEPASKVGTIMGGGGIAPGPEVPDWVLTMRNGAPDAGDFVASNAQAVRLEGDYLWGGAAVKQPGNFVAEHAPRLLLAVRAHPSMRVLFLLPKGVEQHELPAWFWDVLAWLGVTRDRAEFVGAQPVVVERLTVYPQAEHLTGTLDDVALDRKSDPTGLPSGEYLDALADNFSAKGLAPVDHELVYVSRAGTTAPLGGEAYLEEQLAAAGVYVVRPETLDIAEQMRVFAGARHLVFAEGSALHFRQLIGYRPQTITVLQRRPGRRVANGPLLCRADRVDYVNVIAGMVLGPFDQKSGIPVRYAAFPYTDADRLVNAFAEFGVDLRSRWDVRAFRSAFEADLLGWAGYVHGISRQNTLRYALNAAVSLTALGESEELAQKVARAIDPVRTLDRLQDVAPLESERDALAEQRDSLTRQRDSLTARTQELVREVESLRSSASLKLGHAVLAPAILLKEWYGRRTR